MALDSNSNGYKIVKTVAGGGDKTYIKVKQVSDTGVKNFINVAETTGEDKDYTEVMLVDYDYPKDYLRVNFIDGGGAVEPPTDERWYQNFNGASYIKFDRDYAIEGNFYHSFTGTFSPDGFYVLADTNGTGRIIVSSSGDLYVRNAFVGNISVMPILTDGNAHEVVYGRDGSGDWHFLVDGEDALTNTTSSNEAFFIDSFASQYGGSTGIPLFQGYAWNHKIVSPTNAVNLEFNLDESFSEDRVVYDVNGEAIGVKYNDVADDYTQAEPS